MKRSFLVLALMLYAISSNAISPSNSDTVTYQVIKDNNRFFLEVPFGLGVSSSAMCYPSMYGDFRDTHLYYGLNGKYYLDNHMRLDLGYKASYIGTDEFEDLEYSSEILIRANYPILMGQHKWGELIFMGSRYFLANTPKYRYLNVHGGYFRFQKENKLHLGMNYSTKSYIKASIPSISRSKTSFSYFEVGGEVLYRVAKSDDVNYYYEFYNENPNKLGWNTYIIYSYSYMYGKMEIGGHNGPNLKFTVGVIIPG